MNRATTADKFGVQFVVWLLLTLLFVLLGFLLYQIGVTSTVVEELSKAHS